MDTRDENLVIMLVLCTASIQYHAYRATMPETSKTSICFYMLYYIRKTRYSVNVGYANVHDLHSKIIFALYFPK